MVSGRANIIGPFDAKLAASQDAIDQAKRFERSAKEELEQHRRWLKGYIATEARDRAEHERRLWLMEVVPRRRLKRQLIMRRAKRAAWKFARAVRAVALLLWSVTVTVLSHLRRWLVAGTAWTTRQLLVLAQFLAVALAAGFIWTKRNLAVPLGRLLAAGWTFTRNKARVFARWFSEASSAGLSWTARQAAAFDRKLAAWLRAAWAWGLVQGRAFAVWLAEASARGTAWSKRRAAILARSTARHLSTGSTWLRKAAYASWLWLRHAAAAAHTDGVRRTRRLAREFPVWAADGRRLAQRYGAEVLSRATALSGQARLRVQDLKRSIASMPVARERVANAGPSPEADEAFLREATVPPQHALVPVRQQSRALVPMTQCLAPVAMAGPARAVADGTSKSRPRVKKNRPLAKAGPRKRRRPRKRKSA